MLKMNFSSRFKNWVSDWKCSERLAECFTCGTSRFPIDSQWTSIDRTQVVLNSSNGFARGGICFRWHQRVINHREKEKEKFCPEMCVCECACVEIWTSFSVFQKRRKLLGRSLTWKHFSVNGVELRICAEPLCGKALLNRAKWTNAIRYAWDNLSRGHLQLCVLRISLVTPVTESQ